jgi:hypothetical protein
MSYRLDVITEALTGLREARLMQRANEAAMKMSELHESCRAYAREVATEQKDKVRHFKEKVEFQLSLIAQEVHEIDCEIEILGEDVFDQEATRQQLMNLLHTTQNQLQHAIAI